MHTHKCVHVCAVFEKKRMGCAKHCKIWINIPVISLHIYNSSHQCIKTLIGDVIRWQFAAVPVTMK